MNQKNIMMKKQLKTSRSKSVLKPKEEAIHLQVAKYLKLQYPKVLFRTDFAAGLRMTIGQAVKQKKIQHSRAWPDLFIAHPSGGYHGLFLELKRDVSEIVNKNGSLKKSDHLDEQRSIITHLNQIGYKSVFACGFDHARSIIDEYLKNEK
jgi:hypothetical protein